MLIRPLEHRELSALLQLYLHLHAADAPLPEPSIVESVWKELLSSPRYRCLGAFAGEQLVASCSLTIIPNLTRACRPYGVIENVVTHANHRRLGHGTAVVRAALREAWAADCYKVMLLTGRQDEGTFRFYESVGFDRHAKQAFVARPPRSARAPSASR